jgi:DNA-binding MarR family transcriptional regulator
VPAPPATSSELDTLADIVSRLRRALRRGVRADVPFESMSVAQIELLQLLEDQPGLRASMIGERLLLAPTTVSTLVSALLSGELIERTADPDDRRAWQLSLTPAGTARLAEWQQANKRVLHGALDRLNAADQKALRGALPALTKLVANLDQTRDPA